jgi:hypothetical protein
MATLRQWLRDWLGIAADELKCRAMEAKLADAEASIDALMVELSSFKDALKARATRSESVFGDGGKLPVNKPTRFVPLAIRRAQAEAAARGPQNHDAQVRDANVKAMEVAG